MSKIRVDSSTSLYGIVGYPLGYSFSPYMQTLGFQAIGINAVYLSFPVKEDDLLSILNSFELLRIRGFNITVPYKERFVSLVDELSPEAQLLGSVNTVVFNENRWKGYCTDGVGFVRSLKESKIEFRKKRFLILGAGGSAKAIAISLAMEDVAEICVINRTLSRAERLVEIIDQVNPSVLTSTNPPFPKDFDIMVNCTSVGMMENKLPISYEFIEGCETIIDIIYNPPKTELLKIAEKMGKNCMNGIDMLLFQGVEAFEIWTSKKAPVEKMRRGLIECLQPVP